MITMKGYSKALTITKISMNGCPLALTNKKDYYERYSKGLNKHRADHEEQHLKRQ